jgi:hypothetical protein
MKFMCPHCGGSGFRSLNGVNGKLAAQSLDCGRISTFDQSMLPGSAETSAHRRLSLGEPPSIDLAQE